MKLLPSLKQMEYLVALADTVHFAEAAERCHITPSTLSAGIRDLENILGVAVAERTKRHVLMTPIGSEIAERARLILRDAEDVMSLAASNREPLSGDMRMGAIPTISPFLLPTVLPLVNERHPRLRLFLIEDKTDLLLERLRRGDIDVALIALPYETQGLSSLFLFEDEFQFVCSDKHPYAKKKLVRAPDIAEQPLMLLEEGHCLRGHALDACQLPQGKERSQFEASSLHTLVQMVAAGIGVTLLPNLAIDAGIAQNAAVSVIPLAKKPARQIGLVWRTGSHRSDEFKKLGQAFLDGNA